MIKKRDYAKIEKFLINFLQKNIQKTGLNNAILGISGGIDSAIVAVLAKKALKNNFLGLMIPTNNSNPSSLEDAQTLCHEFNINYKIIPIGDIVETYSKQYLDNDKIRMGNFVSRMRMAVLYDQSAKEKSLVLGTSNKSELMLGYGTIYGDLAYAINPLSQLYKTEIFEFATHLKIPEIIISKPPSADLWEGQNDEEELGYCYKEIDPVLHDISEKKLKEKKLKEKYEIKLVDMVLNRIKRNAFKHRLPITAKFDKNFKNFDFLFSRKI